MNSIIKTLQYKYALSENGAKDMVRAFAACTFSDLVLMIPAGLLYQFIDTVYTADAPISGSQILFFGIGILVGGLSALRPSSSRRGGKSPWNGQKN